jgi:hypothetical protein
MLRSDVAKKTHSEPGSRTSSGRRPHAPQRADHHQHRGRVAEHDCARQRGRDILAGPTESALPRLARMPRRGRWSRLLRAEPLPSAWVIGPASRAEWCAGASHEAEADQVPDRPAFVPAPRRDFFQPPDGWRLPDGPSDAAVPIEGFPPEPCPRPPRCGSSRGGVLEGVDARGEPRSRSRVLAKKSRVKLADVAAIHHARRRPRGRSVWWKPIPREANPGAANTRAAGGSLAGGRGAGAEHPGLALAKVKGTEHQAVCPSAGSMGADHTSASRHRRVAPHLGQGDHIPQLVGEAGRVGANQTDQDHQRPAGHFCRRLG